MNIEALQIIETVLFSISAISLLTASQFWLYRYGYRNGKEVGEHTGFTKGLYQGKIRENHRLTQEARRGKIDTNKWANSNTKQTASALSTR
jgi:hypothetical protein